jgi:hypothetical protein
MASILLNNRLSPKKAMEIKENYLGLIATSFVYFEFPNETQLYEYCIGLYTNVADEKNKQLRHSDRDEDLVYKMAAHAYTMTKFDIYQEQAGTIYSEDPREPRYRKYSEMYHNTTLTTEIGNLQTHLLPLINQDPRFHDIPKIVLKKDQHPWDC